MQSSRLRMEVIVRLENVTLGLPNPTFFLQLSDACLAFLLSFRKTFPWEAKALRV